MSEQDDNQEDGFAEEKLIQAIENQIESENPPAARAVFNKLTLVGYERDEALGMMAYVLPTRSTPCSPPTALSTAPATSMRCVPCRRCRTTNERSRADWCRRMPLVSMRFCFAKRLPLW